MESGANTPTKTKRDLFNERMKSKYPDREFADDEAMFGQINDDYDNYDKELSGYKEREGQFVDMFSSDPRSARFLTNWKNGSDPAIELVRQFGTDIREAIDDPERQEEMAKANKEFVDRVAEEKKLDETYKTNLQATLDMLSAKQEKQGLSDEQIDGAMEFLVGIVRDGVMGKFTEESVDMAIKALNYETDVNNAAYEGEVRGKNTKATEQLRKPQGDGIPNLNSKNAGSGTQRKKRSSIFEMAEEAQ